MQHQHLIWSFVEQSQSQCISLQYCLLISDFHRKPTSPQIMSDAHVVYKRQILFSVDKIHIKYVILSFIIGNNEFLLKFKIYLHDISNWNRLIWEEYLNMFNHFRSINFTMDIFDSKVQSEMAQFPIKIALNSVNSYFISLSMWHIK